MTSIVTMSSVTGAFTIAHQDYHNWDNNEDRTYRQYYSEQHRDYRDYDKLNRRQQNEYWNWRHNHSDGEERHEDRH